MNIDELVRVIGDVFVNLFPKKDDPDPWEAWKNSKTLDEISYAIAEAIMPLIEQSVADLERENERLKEQLQAVEDRADKNFESYARIKDKYSIEVNSNKQLTERCMVLEGDVESWHLQFSIADADLDLTKEKVGKMETEIQQQQQTIERLEGLLEELKPEECWTFKGPHHNQCIKCRIENAMTHKTGGEKE